MEIVYFSHYSGNTKKFVEKITDNATRIPIKWDESEPLIVDKPYVLFVPTYGGGNDNHVVPKQVVKFLNILDNRQNIKAVVGMGNTNFGEHYCRGADVIARKTGVPVIYRVEITGTLDDVVEVNKRMELLWQTTVTTN